MAFVLPLPLEKSDCHLNGYKNCNELHELSRKGQKIRDNSRKFVAKLTLKIITP